MDDEPEFLEPSAFLVPREGEDPRHHLVRLLRGRNPAFENPQATPFIQALEDQLRFLEIGESERDPSLDATELAAWTVSAVVFCPALRGESGYVSRC